MSKGIFKDGKYVFDKEKQHEFSYIYIIPFIGIPFLPILFFSSRVSMFGKAVAFVIQACEVIMILCILTLYLGFCSGR